MSSPNVAVVGGGIAGCSAAWFLRQALGEGASLTVYERDAQLGGRLATLDVGGTPVESGGTIIHETNRYLANFVDHLALERIAPHQREEGDADSVGVWDGQRFAFRTRNSALVTRLAAVLSFGVIAPLRLQRAVARGVEQWNQVYEHLERGTAFDSPSALCSELGLVDLLHKDGRQWLADSGVRGRFVDQYATPVGRIMYGQDVTMNGLATSIALAGAGLAGSLFSVGGGNRRVCEGLVRDAGAMLQTGTEVAGVSREGAGFTVQLSEGRSVSHDVVVLATPAGPGALALSGVEPPESALRARPFQITWATFIKGRPALNTSAWPARATCPTRCSPWRTTRSHSARWAWWRPRPMGRSSTSCSVEIQSRSRFWTSSSAAAMRSSRSAGRPTRSCARANDLPPFRLADGLYWVNAMEFAVSTMETEAVAARNVANLVAAQLASSP